MIVDGTRVFVGQDRAAALDAIRRAAIAPKARGAVHLDRWPDPVPACQRRRPDRHRPAHRPCSRIIEDDLSHRSRAARTAGRHLAHTGGRAPVGRDRPRRLEGRFDADDAAEARRDLAPPRASCRRVPAAAAARSGHGARHHGRSMTSNHEEPRSDTRIRWVSVLELPEASCAVAGRGADPFPHVRRHRERPVFLPQRNHQADVVAFRKRARQQPRLQAPDFVAIEVAQCVTDECRRRARRWAQAEVPEGRREFRRVDPHGLEAWRPGGLGGCRRR